MLEAMVLTGVKAGYFATLRLLYGFRVSFVGVLVFLFFWVLLSAFLVWYSLYTSCVLWGASRFFNDICLITFKKKKKKSISP